MQTGVRVGLRGAQGIYGIAADLTCLGKAVSGGFPVSVLGGRRDLMALVADRQVFQAGTYNTNPLCLAAILATLDRLSEPGTYEQMASRSQRLRGGLAEIVLPLGGYAQGTTTLFGLGFGPGPVRTMRDGWRNDTAKMMDFKRALWSRGPVHKAHAAGYLVSVHRAHRRGRRHHPRAGRRGCQADEPISASGRTSPATGA